jgi:hypothetical protein
MDSDGLGISQSDHGQRSASSTTPSAARTTTMLTRNELACIQATVRQPGQEHPQLQLITFGVAEVSASCEPARSRIGSAPWCIPRAVVCLLPCHATRVDSLPGRSSETRPSERALKCSCVEAYCSGCHLPPPRPCSTQCALAHQYHPSSKHDTWHAQTTGHASNR